MRDSSSTIKYEEASSQLGEDGAQETDQFCITVTGAGDEVRVTTKAATSRVTSTLDLTTPGESVHDANGFEITYVGTENGQFTFTVSSVDNDHALSYIEFDFIDGEVSVEEGGCQVTRLTDDGGTG